MTCVTEAAAAQDADGSLRSGEILVTATRTGTRDAAVSTVTAVDLARLQGATVLDALNDVPGVRAVSTGGIGGESFVSIRGGEPNFTLVLIDGVRVNDTTNAQGGAFDFSLIDPALVSAIEVNRSAASAVHGADALSGVINIRLREPEGSVLASGHVATGSDGQRGFGAASTLAWPNGGLLIGGSGYASGPSDPASHLERRQGLVRLSQRTHGYDVSGLALYARTNRSAFPLDSGGPDFAVRRDRTVTVGEQWLGALSVRRDPSRAIRPNFAVNWSRFQGQEATPVIAPGVLSGVPATKSRDLLNRVEATADVTAAIRFLTATVGADVLLEHARSDGSVDFGFVVPTRYRLARQTISGFAETSIRPSAGLTVNSGIRFDGVKDGPQQWTIRGGVEWQPAPSAPALFAHYDEGFKLPSFYALGNPLVGDSALRSERSRDRELGLTWLPTTVARIRLAWFDNHFRDLIDFDPTIFRLVNRAAVVTRGIEADGEWSPAKSVSLSAGATRSTAHGAAPLFKRPRWQGNLRAAWQATPEVEISGAARFNSAFLDASIPTGTLSLNGHVEADASIQWQLRPHWRLLVSLRNISDSRAAVAVGYPQLGRRLLVTLNGTTR